MITEEYACPQGLKHLVAFLEISLLDERTVSLMRPQGLRNYCFCIAVKVKLSLFGISTK
jgi:hypothetical protein